MDSSTHAAGHGGVGRYTTGFLLSLGLTVLSFGAIWGGWAPPGAALAVIVVLALAQLLVQLVYFLHLGRSPDARENTVVFVLTALLILILVAGSLWVMHNANQNMMPLSPKQALSRD
jgi:cytochrome o ubiquinol oxidase operon protein cyoD